MNVSRMTIDELETFARSFSDKLKDILSQNDGPEAGWTTLFGPFPRGGCMESSRWLCFALADNHFPTTYVKGTANGREEIHQNGVEK